MISLAYAFSRAKLWVADQLGLSRLFATATYLLVRQLNIAPSSEGPDGNKRLQNAFLSLFTILRPNTLLDIGANDGSASVMVREFAPDCAVHAFEANPQIYSKHLERLKNCGIHYWNFAIHDRVGPVILYRPRSLSRAYIGGEIVEASILEGEDTGKSSLLQRNEDATYEEMQVQGTTLDAFVDAHVLDWPVHTFFLWIDVEGASDRVLRGGKRLLSRTRAIFIETEGSRFWHEQADCDAIVTRLIRAGFLPIARDQEYGDKQFNILFVHRDAVDPILPLLFDNRGPFRLAGEIEAKSAIERSHVNTTAPPQPYLSLGMALQADIPVFIPCFNAVTYTGRMVEQLRARGLRRLYLVDNGSTYLPMREYLAGPGPYVTVVKRPDNKGPHDIFKDPASFALLPQLFCITDPDLLLNPEMPDDFLAQLAELTESLSVGKAGLALDISNTAAMRQEDFLIGEQHYKIWEWEEQFWREPLQSLPEGDPVYKADIDTTFAVYNKRFFDPSDCSQAVRVAGRFTCQHLPWFKNTGLPEEEERFYRRHARGSYYMRDADNPGGK